MDCAVSNLTLRSVKFDYEKKTNNRALARANAGFLPNSHESFSLMNLHRAERLRRAVEAMAVPPVARITASFGVAEARPTDTPLTLLRRADEAMYRAKRKGKNRVEAAPK